MCKVLTESFNMHAPKLTRVPWVARGRTIVEAAGALQSGDLTARELMQETIRGTEAAQHLNAYIGGVSSTALLSADESDRQV